MCRCLTDAAWRGGGVSCRDETSDWSSYAPSSAGAAHPGGNGSAGRGRTAELRKTWRGKLPVSWQASGEVASTGGQPRQPQRCRKPGWWQSPPSVPEDLLPGLSPETGQRTADH